MQTIQLNKSLLRSLLMLTTVIEARDRYTAGHTWRVGQYARRLAERAGFSADEIFITHLGCLVHDIGKVSVPDSALNKREPLTADEFGMIKKHPEVGRLLIQEHPLSPIVIDIVAQHHERFDGGGYPSGLAGAEISIFSRIAAIADAFDAMTSTRAYRVGMAPPIAYEILRRERGKQFDPYLATIFLEMGESGELDHIIGHSSEERRLLTCPECGPLLVVPRHARNGDFIFCPGCTGQYLLHLDGDTFDAEWVGTCDPTLVPKPDEDMVEGLIEEIPWQIKLAA